MIVKGVIILMVVAVLVLCAVVGSVIWLGNVVDQMDLFDPWK